MGGGGWGWPAGSNETKANSAQFGLNWGLAGLSLAKNTEHFNLIVLDLTFLSGGTRSLGKMGLRSTLWVAFNISKVALSSVGFREP